MYKSIIFAFVVLFFVIGVITVISFIMIKAVWPDKKDNIYVVCPFGRDDRECAVKVSCVISILTAIGLISRCFVAVIDSGMLPQEKENILFAFGNDPRILICDSEKFCRVLDENNDKSP
ncbi:MAG: hypothetical protein IKL47_08425 [Clostridia bacterium]|nr:hypothetical protein [Clostridia bacterium]